MAGHLPSTEMLGTTGQQVTVVEAVELEVLAGRTELKEAPGHEELADVISRGGGRFGTRPPLQGPITRGQVTQ